MSLVCLGVLILDMFPTESGKKIVEQKLFKPAPGGAPANVAVAASHLGVKSAFIGKVGNDVFGHFLAESIKNEGVDISGVRFDDYSRTTMNFHAKLPDGSIEYCFYRNPGADTNLLLNDLDMELIKSASILHYDSLCLTDEPSKTTTIKAIEAVRAAGACVSFDVNYRPVVWENKQQAIDVIFERLLFTDILKLNEDEVKLLCPNISLEDATDLLIGRGPKLCIVTLGAKGSYYKTNKGGQYVPAYPVNVVDTIGCGDAFIGGFLFQLIKSQKSLDALDQHEIEKFMIYADTVAAITATRYGAIPALPSAEEVNAAFRDRGYGI